MHAGLHGGLRAPHNLTHNQCGIVVEKSSGKDTGEWTCHVLLNKAALKAVTTVGRGEDAGHMRERERRHKKQIVHINYKRIIYLFKKNFFKE